MEASANGVAPLSNASSEKPEKNMKITDLNDTCLFNIFNHLNLLDQLNLARSCGRFDSAFFQYCEYTTCGKLDIDHEEFQKLSVTEQHELLSVVGGSIYYITNEFELADRDTTFELLGTFCPNVTILKLCGLHGFLSTPIINQLVDNMQMITKLDLFSLHDGISDDDILCFKKLPRLLSLLLYSFEITGQHLKELTSLQTLYLAGCINLQSHYLMEMIEALVDLRDLNLAHCPGVTAEVCEKITRHSFSLTILALDLRDSGFEVIANLPSLNCLELYVDKTYIRTEMCVRDMLRAFSSYGHPLAYLKIMGHKHHKLKKLPQKLARLKHFNILDCEVAEIVGDKWWNHSSKLNHSEQSSSKHVQLITNDDLLSVLINCTNLFLMYIRGFEYNITSAFLEKPVEFLTDEYATYRQPVTLKLDYSASSGMDTHFDGAVKRGIISEDSWCENTSDEDDYY